MNTRRLACLDQFFISLPQNLSETLGRLQIQEPDPISESLYIYDLIEQRTLSASCSIATMLGYTANVTHGIEAVELGNLIHPDDLDLVSDHCQRFTTLRSGDVITTSYRMRRADGAWCWLQSQETPFVMAIDRFPLQILGIVRLLPQFLKYSLEK